MTYVFRFLVNMPSFLEAKLNLASAQSKTTKFTTIDPSKFEGQDNLPRLFKLSVTFLYASQPAKKIGYSKTTKNYGQASRKLEVDKYHRFFLLNAAGSSCCYALFSENSEESRKMLRYAAYFGPGTQLNLLKPELIGHLSRGQTMLLKTNEPLVPVATPTQIPVPPPFDVESSNYCGFLFTTKALKLDSALVAENVCPSTLCDGQTYHEACPCLETSQDKTWVISLAFTCPELTTEINNAGDVFRVTSNALTNFFVTPTARCLKGDNEKLDRFELDAAVEKLIESVNGSQGFTIQGWFKPAIDEEGVAVENKKFHICNIAPATALSDTQLALRYNGTST